MQEYLNISGNPGEVFRLDCLHDEIVVLKCCLSTEIAKTERKIQSGIKCPNDVIENLRYRQLLLNKLTCIDFDNLDKECLTEEQISQIILYLKNKCKNCKIWADDVVKCTEPQIPCYSCGGGDPDDPEPSDCQLTTGIIKNPSFEEYTICPTQNSDFYFQDWTRGNYSGTPDYANTCGWTFSPGVLPANILNNIPNGNGFIAMVALASNSPIGEYRESIGQCLAVPLTANKKYKLTFNTASAAMGRLDSQCVSSAGANAIFFGNMKWTLYGANDCTNDTGLHLTNTLGYIGHVCPTNTTNSFAPWTTLGEVIYTPKEEWSEVSIEFTPQATVQAIIIGPPCTIDSSYTVDGSCYPWFFLDNIRLCQYV